MVTTNQYANAKPLIPVPNPKKKKSEYADVFGTELLLPMGNRTNMNYSGSIPFNGKPVIIKHKDEVAKPNTYATVLDMASFPRPTINPANLAGTAEKEEQNKTKPAPAAMTDEALQALIKKKAEEMLKNNPTGNELLMANAFEQMKKLEKKLQYKEPKQRNQPLGYWDWGGASGIINQAIPSFQFMYGPPKKGFSMPVGVRWRPDWLRRGVARDAQDQHNKRAEREGAANEAIQNIRHKEIFPRQWANTLALAPLRSLQSRYGYGRTRLGDGGVAVRKQLATISSLISKDETSLSKAIDTGLDAPTQKIIRNRLVQLRKAQSELLAQLYNFGVTASTNNNEQDYKTEEPAKKQFSFGEGLNRVANQLSGT